MKKFTWRIIVPALSGIAALCLLAACGGILEVPSGTPFGTAGGSKTGRVLVSITGAEAAAESAPEAPAAAPRTLLPSPGDLDYKLEFTRQGQTEPVLTKTISVTALDQDLEAGTYTLTVTACKTGTSVAVAGGSAPLTVQAGQPVSVTVPLALTAGQTGTGSLNYAITLSGGISLAGGSLILYPLSGGADPVYIDLNAGASGVKTMPSGYYRVQFSVYGSTGGVIKFAAKTGVLHINDSFTTTASYTLAAGDFTDTDLTGDKLYIAENSTQLQDALTSIYDASETVFTILVSASFSSPPVSLPSAYDGKTIILRGSGGVREISLSSQGSLFTIGSASGGPVFIVRDIAMKGITDNNAALLKLRNGELIMESGATVTGNTASYFYSDSSANFSSYNSNGGGVYVAGGTFTMRGSASVYGNTASPSSSGSYIYGGGVFVLEGTFTMEDNASVSGNTASASSAYTHGGGVYVAGGSFTAKGSASVSDNTASAGTKASCGGGVYVRGGSFTIKDNASVRGNLASSASTSTYGGGVYVANGTSFAMQDNSSISGNRVSGSASFSVGGGVYIDTTGTLSKNGGLIYGSNETGIDSDGNDLKNTALTYNAHAVYYHASPAKIRGTTVELNQNLSTGSSANWSD
jgi:hypothetical protein